MCLKAVALFCRVLSLLVFKKGYYLIRELVAAYEAISQNSFVKIKCIVDTLKHYLFFYHLSVIHSHQRTHLLARGFNIAVE